MDSELKKLVQNAARIENLLALILKNVDFFLRHFPFDEEPEPVLDSKGCRRDVKACRGDVITSLSKDSRELITLAELSQLTGIPKKTLHNWTAPGVKHSPLGFKPIRAGRKKYFRREDINKFLDVQKVK